MESPLPLYVQLAPGDQLPSHHALCRQDDMSYMTVRRTITELSNEGVIYNVSGKRRVASGSEREEWCETDCRRC